jgi:glycosyltransferase involved in cell wall biosynthesis
LFLAQNVPVYGLTSKENFGWFERVSRVRRLVQSLGIDVIHTQLFSADVIGGVAGRLSGVPVVSTLANTCYEPEWLIDNPHLNRLKLFYLRTVRKYVARYCDRHLIAVSESVKASAVARLGVSPNKVSVIYRGLSPEWLLENGAQNVEALRQTLKLPIGGPVLINTGRLIPQKGQRYLLEAMPYILRRFPEALLLVVGEGFLQPQLEALARHLAIQDHVHLLGKRSDVRHLLQLGDIFVFPSLYEGCPNALIEALSIGLPSIASRIGPVEEVTQNGELALLVPTTDPKALAEGVIALASDPARVKVMGEAAKAVIRGKFSVHTVGEKLMTCFERVANGEN